MHWLVSEFRDNEVGFPRTLENLENLEDKKINFQAWKSPGKKKMNMSLKNPGIFLKYV